MVTMQKHVPKYLHFDMRVINVEQVPTSAKICLTSVRAERLLLVSQSEFSAHPFQVL